MIAQVGLRVNPVGKNGFSNGVKEKIGIPADWEILLSFCLGKTDSFPEAPERKKPEMIFG